MIGASPHPAADLLRVLSLALGGGLVILSVSMSRRYATEWWKLRRTGAESFRRVLTAHVALISGSYAGMVTLTVLEVYQRVHQAATYRTWVFPPLYVVGIVAVMYLMRDTRTRR